MNTCSDATSSVLQQFEIVLQNVLASNEHGVVEEAIQLQLSLMNASCGPRLYFSVCLEWRLGCPMPSKNWNRARNLLTSVGCNKVTPVRASTTGP